MSLPVRTGNGPAAACVLLASGLAAVLAGCGTGPVPRERPAASSYGCMREAIRDRVPAGLDDATRHCLASGLIALYCSPAEATLAGWGKELAGLLGEGDAEAADLRADRRGRDCARATGDAGDLLGCCLATASAGGRDLPDMRDWPEASGSGAQR